VTRLSPDARAVVAAVDRLTTQVARLADGASADRDDAPTTADDAQRTTRRQSLRIILDRASRGVILRSDEAALLRQHVAAEQRDADTARAALEQAQAATGRVSRTLQNVLATFAAGAAPGEPVTYLPPYPVSRETFARWCAALDGTEQPTTTEQPDENARLIAEYQAAILRILALREPIAEALEQADYSGNMRRGDLADAIMPVIRATVAEGPADPEALHAKVEEATATLRRVRSVLATLKGQGATGHGYHQAITNALAGPRPDDD